MVHGSIDVLVVAARNLKDTEVFGKMDPFIQLRVDSQTKKSRTAYAGGKNPTFNDNIQFNVIDGVRQLAVDVYDEDTVSNDHIGTATIDLTPAFQTGTLDAWFPLTRHKTGKPAGEVRLCIYFSARQPGAPAPTPAYNAQPVSNGYPGNYAPAPVPVNPNPYPPQPMYQAPPPQAGYPYPPQPQYPAQMAPYPVYPAGAPPPQPGYPMAPPPQNAGYPPPGYPPYPAQQQQGYPPQPAYPPRPY